MPKKLPLHLAPEQERRALTFSLFDGLFYALMVGLGEIYMVAYAIRLGATPWQLGLVVALPLFVAGIGPLVVLGALRGSARRKPLVVASAMLQAGVLLGLAAANRLDVHSPELLILGACLHQMFGQAVGTAWSSWFGDVVPVKARGGFFARRTRVVYFATFLGLIAGGVLLQVLEPVPAGEGGPARGGDGFQVLFLLAGCSRALGAMFLLATPEPRFHGLPGPARLVRFLRTGKGSNAWRLVALGCVFNLAVYLSAPFYGPFMLEELQFSYLAYMAASGCLVALKVFLLPGWGRTVDQLGARPVLLLAMFLGALVPLPWLWTDGIAWALVAQAFSGSVWGGYEVALFALMLDSTFKGTRLVVFAAQSVANGTGQLLGGLAGAALLDATGRSFATVFAVSLGCRLAVAMMSPRILKDLAEGPPVGRREIMLRVIGFRPDSGLNHRPVPEPVRPPPAARASAPQARTQGT